MNMATQATYLSRFPTLREGMTVYSKDGEKLGKITGLFQDYFLIEKGFFFPKDFTLRYEDIQDIEDDTVRLLTGQTEYSDWRNESYVGWRQADEINAGRITPEPLEEYRNLYKDRFTEEARVPVSEEELRADKTTTQVGEIKVRKIVHSELRHFTVPVMKEEVRIERVPVSGREGTLVPDESTFQEKTISIPVTEEEITVSKRPVVKEEVRVSKERITREEPVEGEVRKEEVRIEGEDQLKRKKAG
jgi:uncharacterized protein (TIGR02271 family)